MSIQWNRTSSISTEPIFSEEDFVWVETPETQDKGSSTCDGGTLKGKTEEQFSPNCSSHILTPCDDDISEEEFLYHTSINECSSDCFPENVEHEYVNQCIKKKVKPFNPDNGKYPNLHWLKRSERGVFSVEKLELQRKQKLNDKSDCEEKYKHLPKMKFDPSTTAILEMSINNRYLGEYTEMIARGKNYVVFHAGCHRKNCMTMPGENAVKIYKTSLDEKKNKMIYRQVQREFEHLCLLKRWRTQWFSPCPVKAWKNVIIMRFIGKNKTVTPTIEAVPSDKDQLIYNDIVDHMGHSYHKANLVHGDLSVKNLRYGFNKVFFIGWSKSVERNNPMADTNLMKDCRFLTEFYENRGLPVKSAIDLFKDISGKETVDSHILEAFEEKDLYEKYKNNPNRRKASPVKPTPNERFK